MGWSYRVFTHTINISDMLGIDKLSEHERDTHISDVITHEYMHHLMHKHFNATTSSLFDCIERHFRDMSILEKLLACVEGETHTTYIKRMGIRNYLIHKGINRELFAEAKRVCANGRISNCKTNTKGLYSSDD